MKMRIYIGYKIQSLNEVIIISCVTLFFKTVFKSAYFLSNLIYETYPSIHLSILKKPWQSHDKGSKTVVLIKSF